MCMCFGGCNGSCFHLLVGYQHQVRQVVVPMMQRVVKTEIHIVWTLPRQALLPISTTVLIPRRPWSAVVHRRRPLRSAAFRLAIRWNRGLHLNAVLRQLHRTTLRLSLRYRLAFVTTHHCCDLTMLTSDL